ncbi:MAG: bifunctional tRNA (5-methylaminomethyl-2-thiouridine)(34)-methyltransferase MnmD/FAD-dependent 5-carboxymethylaminomethyl-2-thiouridine(34) oxidoreductase MnmC [Leptospira sp.]|nr:bifunctional tRNA (5-methylaminomethyl-2-thiouridine)(34)-methyltransferase MnmD/FAD-dependent 5-carboxymethylaminomethyl-2-thiouridine(34) oxidoreductase MnmC [Leptospira sp.]
METPFSDIYGDVYFSKEGGLDETRYVFLDGNKLRDRWQSLENGNFTIAETGFGTGLNFLATWKLWEEGGCASRGKWLYYISVEAHPLDTASIQKYLEVLPELKPYLNQLLEQYRLYSPGFYKFQFPSSKISLLILFGKAESVLEELDAEVDAWFLDGFSPSKNPEMWSSKVFNEMARLSRTGTTFATYTSAGFVRKGLEAVGFAVRKVPGFGRKREMSVGVMSKVGGSNSHSDLDRFAIFPNNRKKKPSHINILGAGIAGASLAYALSLREITSHVFDPNGIANGASGNPAGIFYPYLTKFPIPSSLFSLHCFYHALNQFRSSKFQSSLGAQGLDFLLDTQAKKDRYLSALESFPIPESVASLSESKDKIHFPEGRTIFPKEFVNALLDSKWIHFHNEDYFEVYKQKQTSDSYSDLTSGFNLTSSNELEGKAIIAYCNSFHLNSWLAEKSTAFPYLKKVRGQLAYLDSEVFVNPPSHPLCCDSYITPLDGKMWVVGSTYDEYHPDDPWRETDELKIIQDMKQLTEVSSTLSNPKNLNQWMDNRKLKMVGDGWEGNLYRVSHRAQSKDRQPIIGNLFNSYVYSGLGSRGLVYSLLGGEILACIILGEPLPIPISVYRGISPQRFLKN